MKDISFYLFNQCSRGFIIVSISVCEYVIPEAAFVVSIQVNVVVLVGMFLMMIANTSDIYELLWLMSTITKANLFLVCVFISLSNKLRFDMRRVCLCARVRVMPSADVTLCSRR